MEFLDENYFKALIHSIVCNCNLIIFHFKWKLSQKFTNGSDFCGSAKNNVRDPRSKDPDFLDLWFEIKCSQVYEATFHTFLDLFHFIFHAYTQKSSTWTWKTDIWRSLLVTQWAPLCFFSQSICFCTLVCMASSIFWNTHKVAELMML